MNREQVRNAIKALGIEGDVTSVGIWDDKVVWESVRWEFGEPHYEPHTATIEEYEAR